MRKHLEEKLEQLHGIESLILCLMRSIDTAQIVDLKRAADTVDSLIDDLCADAEPMDMPPASTEE
jgi:hypothetical protein